MAFIPSSIPLIGSKLSKKAINNKAKLTSQPKNDNARGTSKAKTGEVASANTTTNPIFRGFNVQKAPPLRKEKDDDSSSSSSDSFSTPQSRNPFYDDTRQEPVTYKHDIESTVHTQQLEKPLNNDKVFSAKLMVNISKFSRSYPSSTESSNEVVQQYKLIYNELSRTVLKEVRNKLVDIWTFENFYKAINDGASGLEFFYALDSILSYKGSDTVRDKNIANMSYQENIEGDSSILYLKDNLRRSLKGIWFPPKFSNLIFWTYQTYKTADIDQACNYRHVPHHYFVNADIGNPGNYLSLSYEVDAVISKLNDSSNVKIWSILSQVMPQGEIVGLPKSCSVAVYDQRHYETWCNQPVMWNLGVTAHIFPTSESLTDKSFTYGMNVNPKGGSGLPFILQTQFRNETAPPVIDFFRTVKKDFAGLSNDYKCNKFAVRVDESTGNQSFGPRVWSIIENESADMHMVNYDKLDISKHTEKSRIASGFQPVYFDLVTAPLISLREFLRSLFELI
jgi:hypothetical protein